MRDPWKARFETEKFSHELRILIDRVADRIADQPVGFPVFTAVLETDMVGRRSLVALDGRENATATLTNWERTRLAELARAQAEERHYDAYWLEDPQTTRPLVAAEMLVPCFAEIRHLSFSADRELHAASNPWTALRPALQHAGAELYRVLRATDAASGLRCHVLGPDPTIPHWGSPDPEDET